jgi:hypothetical protein
MVVFWGAKSQNDANFRHLAGIGMPTTPNDTLYF